MHPCEPPRNSHFLERLHDPDWAQIRIPTVDSRSKQHTHLLKRDEVHAPPLFGPARRLTSTKAPWWWGHERSIRHGSTSKPHQSVGGRTLLYQLTMLDLTTMTVTAVRMRFSHHHARRTTLGDLWRLSSWTAAREREREQLNSHAEGAISSRFAARPFFPLLPAASGCLSLSRSVVT